MIGGLLKKVAPTLAAEKYAPRHDGLFHLLEGRRGRGKSYSLTYWARAAVFKRVPVVANFALSRYRLAIQAFQAGTFRSMDEAMAWTHANVRYVGHWDDLLTCYDSLVMLDEVSRVFDSRVRSAPPVALEWLQQSRKLKLTLVFASQSFDWLDVRVRQLADILWMARKEKRRKSTLPARFWLYGLDPWSKGLTDAVLRDRADYLMQLPFALKVATLYDSWEMIRLISGTPSWSTVGELEQYFTDLGAITPGTFSVVTASRAQPGLPGEHGDAVTRYGGVYAV